MSINKFFTFQRKNTSVCFSSA